MLLRDFGAGWANGVIFLVSVSAGQELITFLSGGAGVVLTGVVIYDNYLKAKKTHLEIKILKHKHKQDENAELPESEDKQD